MTERHRAAFNVKFCNVEEIRESVRHRVFENADDQKQRGGYAHEIVGVPNIDHARAQQKERNGNQEITDRFDLHGIAGGRAPDRRQTDKIKERTADHQEARMVDRGVSEQKRDENYRYLANDDVRVPDAAADFGIDEA